MIVNASQVRRFIRWLALRTCLRSRGERPVCLWGMASTLTLPLGGLSHHYSLSNEATYASVRIYPVQ